MQEDVDSNDADTAARLGEAQIAPMTRNRTTLLRVANG